MLEVGPVKILEQAKQATAIEMDPRTAAEVVQGTYVFTLIFNFLTFIFSPFFHPASIFPASDLSFFQYRPAHRKLHVVNWRFCQTRTSKSAYQTPHIKFSVPLSSNFSRIDLCSVLQSSCSSENFPPTCR